MYPITRYGNGILRKKYCEVLIETSHSPESWNKVYQYESFKADLGKDLLS